MNELTNAPTGGLLHTLHSTVQLPAPYSADISLLEVQVAGTTHAAGIAEIEPFLQPGDRLELLRVPDNPTDPNAIKVYTAERVKLGYLPRTVNSVPARLMDAGKLLYAVLRRKAWVGDWLKLEIEVFLCDD